jgi:hypothetical protein
MLKKKGLLVFLMASVCLVSVGCGKDSEKDSSDKKSKDIKTLSCSQEKDGEKLNVVIEQNKKTYKFEKATMKMTVLKSNYEGFAENDEALKKLICNDEEEEYKSCEAKFEGDKVIVSIEFDAEKYGNDLVEQKQVSALDEKTFDELKSSAEKDGATCKIS